MLFWPSLIWPRHDSLAWYYVILCGAARPMFFSSLFLFYGENVQKRKLSSRIFNGIKFRKKCDARIEESRIRIQYTPNGLERFRYWKLNANTEYTFRDASRRQMSLADRASRKCAKFELWLLHHTFRSWRQGWGMRYHWRDSMRLSR